MLHILNGDALRPAWEAAGLPGEAAPWRDMLSEGPVPGGLAGPADWRARGAELEARYGIPAADYARGAEEGLALLDAAAKHDEVALWFERPCVFCFWNAAFVLHRLAPRLPGDARLGLVEGPQPLGAHADPAALQALFAARVDARPLARLAAAAWQAYASPDPRGLEAARAGAGAWPWMREALRLHLARFPSVRDGLDPQERAALRALRDGPRDFDALMAAVQEAPEARGLGSGDVGLAAALRGLAAEPQPLLRAEGEAQPRQLTDLPRGRFALTDLGRDVLAGRADAVRARGVDRWLGGVRLQGKVAWRWDSAQAALAPPA